VLEDVAVAAVVLILVKCQEVKVVVEVAKAKMIAVQKKFQHQLRRVVAQAEYKLKVAVENQKKLK